MTARPFMGAGGRVLQNVASGWVQFALQIGVSLFLTPFVIHRAGLAAYGVFLLVESILGYSEFLYLGLGSAISKYAAHYRATEDLEKMRRLGGTILGMYLACGGVLALAVWAAAPLVPRAFRLDAVHAADAVFVARIIALSTGLAFPASAFSGLLRGYEKIAALNYLKSGELLLRLVLIVGLLQPEGALRTLAGVSFAVGLFGSLSRSLLGLVTLEVLPDPRQFRWATLREVSGFSLFSFLGNVAERILFRTDSIVIGAVISSSAITAYAVPGRLIEYVRQLLMRFREALQPTFAVLTSRGDQEGVRSMLANTGRWAAVLVLPLASMLAFGGAPFLHIWIGEEFKEAPWILGFLAIAQAVRAPSYACEAVLWGGGRAGLIASLTVVEAVANLVLSLCWVGAYGIVGVAAGTMVPSLLLSAIVMPMLACRVSGLPLPTFLWGTWGPTLAAALPMVALHALLRPGTTGGVLDLAWRLAVGLLAYLPLAWWLGLNSADREQIRVRLPRRGRDRPGRAR